MSYGFDNLPMDTLQLPKAVHQTNVPSPAMNNILQAGAELGFISRETTKRRRPGPRRTEAQDKITVTGPKRVIDQLKAYCDSKGSISYCDAIAELLDIAK